jgi:hypothetical protein
MTILTELRSGPSSSPPGRREALVRLTNLSVSTGSKLPQFCGVEANFFPYKL